TDSLIFDIKDVTISVPDLDAALLGKPLDGGPWIAISDASWNSGHRRVIYIAKCVGRILGIDAIDLILLDSFGRFAEGNKNEITSYFGYDANVLAVADGIVVALRNDFCESPTLSDHPKYPPKEATGNYICLKISENRYVFYEHLKPRTIAVKVGQQVKK